MDRTRQTIHQNQNTVGHWVRRIEKLPEGEWAEEIEKVPIDPAYPYKSDMTIRDKVRRIMAKKWRERRVHFGSNEYVYNNETGELEKS